MEAMQQLKDRIFRPDLEKAVQENFLPCSKSGLEEILSWLETKEETVFVFGTGEKKDISYAEQQTFVVTTKEERVPKLFFYKIEEETYYVYIRKQSYSLTDSKEEESYTFIPSGVVVRSVPSHILGPRVLGRAFLHQNYIEILDSLHGHDYQEVLTHELLHLQFPHQPERQVRLMTTRYMPYARYQ